MNWVNKRVLVCAEISRNLEIAVHFFNSRSEVGISCTVFRTAIAAAPFLCTAATARCFALLPRCV